MKKILMSFTLLAGLTSAACPMGCIHKVLAACGLSWTKQEFREIVDRAEIEKLSGELWDHLSLIDDVHLNELSYLMSPFEAVSTLEEYCFRIFGILGRANKELCPHEGKPLTIRVHGFEILKFFIEKKGIDPNLPLVQCGEFADGDDNASFLEVAIFLGLKEVRFVLFHGARVTRRDIKRAGDRIEVAQKGGPPAFWGDLEESAAILSVLEEAFERQQQED